jgi:hypothetical protein
MSKHRREKISFVAEKKVPKPVKVEFYAEKEKKK